MSRHMRYRIVNEAFAEIEKEINMDLNNGIVPSPILNISTETISAEINIPPQILIDFTNNVQMQSPSGIDEYIAQGMFVNQESDLQPDALEIHDDLSLYEFEDFIEPEDIFISSDALHFQGDTFENDNIQMRLYEWKMKYNVSKNALSGLCAILQSRIPSLPGSAETLITHCVGKSVGTIQKVENGDFI